MPLPKIATKKQRKMYKYGLKNPYSLLCADARLGKSMSAIYIQKKRDVNCLIICPSYLVLNWKKEINKWSPKSRVTVFRKGADIYPVVDSDFVIISFDLAQKAEQLFSWCDMVVIDEIHNLKSMAAKRTQFIHKAIFEHSVKYVHGLTGTPLKNRVREFYSLIAMMYYNPRLEEGIRLEYKKGDNFKKFLKKNLGKVIAKEFLKTYPDEITFAEKFSYRESYDVKVTTKRGASFYMPVVKYEGLRNLPELKFWLKGIYTRIRAGKNDLPPITYNDILISDSPNKKLLEAFESFFGEEGNSSVKPDIKVKAAMQKVPFTIKHAENVLEEKGRILIYSDHTEPIEKIAKHFKVPAITGKMSANQRSKLTKQFQAGELNIICATIGSLKEGADLFRAEDMVLNDPPWVPGDLNQVMNRMRAISEKKPRTLHRMLGSPQDQKIYDTLMEKNIVIEAAT